MKKEMLRFLAVSLLLYGWFTIPIALLFGLRFALKLALLAVSELLAWIDRHIPVPERLSTALDRLKACSGEQEG